MPAAGEEPFDSLGWRGPLGYDSPEVVALREDLADSGIPELASLTIDPAQEGFAQQAAQRFAEDGFVVLKNCLDQRRLERLRAATERAVRDILRIDPHRYGNSAHDHRYSFGRASRSGYEHDEDWAVMVDPPPLSAVLTELWGPDYLCNGLGGDFSLPGAVGKQGLHSDINVAFKYEVRASRLPALCEQRPIHTPRA